MNMDSKAGELTQMQVLGRNNMYYVYIALLA
jgi:hypothetical protein